MLLHRRRDLSSQGGDGRGLVVLYLPHGPDGRYGERVADDAEAAHGDDRDALAVELEVVE